MKIFRKYINKLPALIIWSCLFFFFTNAANLDDLVGNITVIHTDGPRGNIMEELSIQTAHCASGHCSSAVYVYNKLEASLNITYNQDSPSLSPEAHDIAGKYISNRQNNKIVVITIVITRILYLEQHSLLI